jgi:hypothetical protein
MVAGFSVKTFPTLNFSIYNCLILIVSWFESYRRCWYWQAQPKVFKIRTIYFFTFESLLPPPDRINKQQLNILNKA